MTSWVNQALLILGEVFAYNLILFVLFAAVAFIFNGFARLRAKGRCSAPIIEWRPTRREWRNYLKTKARSYLFSLILFIAIFLVLSAVMTRGQATAWNSLLMMVAGMLPGLAGYVLLVTLVPNRFAIHEEGITTFGWLHYTTGRRGTAVTEARVGFHPWTKFVGYQWDEDVLLLKTKFASLEVVAGQKKGQIRDLLRERFKEAAKTRRKGSDNSRPKE